MQSQRQRTACLESCPLSSPCMATSNQRRRYTLAERSSYARVLWPCCCPLSRWGKRVYRVRYTHKKIGIGGIFVKLRIQRSFPSHLRRNLHASFFAKHLFQYGTFYKYLTISPVVSSTNYTVFLSLSPSLSLPQKESRHLALEKHPFPSSSQLNSPSQTPHSEPTIPISPPLPISSLQPNPHHTTPRQ